jgi:TonB family protein
MTRTCQLWIGRFALLMAMAGMFVRAPELRAQEQVVRQVKKRVSPLFPPLARQTGLAGTVKIEVVVAPDGKVKSARAVGGPPVFITAALEAAKQWVFTPASMETNQLIEFEFTGPPR